MIPNKLRSQPKLKFESLERRQLLAIDLVIEADASPGEQIAGQEVTRIVRVFNNGDEGANDAVVQLDFSDHLDEVAWSRRPSYAKYLHGPRIRLEEPPGPIELSERRAQEFGDINGDGFGDFAFLDRQEGRTRFFLGSEITVDSKTASLEVLVSRNLDSINVPGTHPFITSAGDLNDDGLGDFVRYNGYRSEFEILLGIPTGTPNVPDIIAVDTGLASGHRYLQSSVIPAGDLNGDGVDDVLFVMQGPFVETTQSGFTLLERVAGATVFFGGKDLPSNESLDYELDGARFSVVSDATLKAGVSDVDEDGTNDIILTLSPKTYVIRGGTDIQSRDFGFSSFDSFDGEFGFGISFLDAHKNRNLPSLDQSSVSGLGDVKERLNIPAGTGWIYTATGKLKDNATSEISASVVPRRSQIDADLRNNRVGLDEPVALVVTIEHEEDVVVGEEIQLSISIENQGPAIANGVEIVETVSSLINNPTWAIETTRLFPSRSDEWDYRLGPWEHGLSYTPWTTQAPIWRQLPNLGMSLGYAGDVNDDGFVDFYVEDSRKSNIYFGGPNFGLSGGFEDVASKTQQEAVPTANDPFATWDFNGDGIGDSVVDNGIALGSESGRAELVRISTDDEIYDLVRIGDINDDGFDEVTIRYSDLCSSPRIVFGHANVTPVSLQAGLPLGPLGEACTSTGRTAEFANAMDYDLNGDSIQDVAVYLNMDGELFVHILFGRADLAQQAELLPSLIGTGYEWLSGPQSLAVGDLNADGIDDLATIMQGDVQIYFGGDDLLNANPVQIGNGISGALETYPVTLYAGLDINVDGTNDLLVGDALFHPTSDGYGTAGAAFVVLGRKPKKLEGIGSFAQELDVYPGEVVNIRLVGTARAESMSEIGQVTVAIAPDQHQLHPSSHIAHINLSERNIADLDGDGEVGFADFLLLADNFGRAVKEQGEDGDLTGDQFVDFTDFLILATNFGDQVS